MLANRYLTGITAGALMSRVRMSKVRPKVIDSERFLRSGRQCGLTIQPSAGLPSLCSNTFVLRIAESLITVILGPENRFVNSECYRRHSDDNREICGGGHDADAYSCYGGDSEVRLDHSDFDATLMSRSTVDAPTSSQAGSGGCRAAHCIRRVRSATTTRSRADATRSGRSRRRRRIDSAKCRGWSGLADARSHTPCAECARLDSGGNVPCLRRSTSA